MKCDRKRLAAQLLPWFDQHQRQLPWRQQKTPYRIWISEIMLQQTQVATVIEYYRRFIKRFPNVKRLAAAEESEVLKFWEGLGYYRRARQLHATARIVVQDYDGRFPTDFAQVIQLPGIGRYTAGAILSISQDQRLPILEGNTIRLFARWLGMTSDPRSGANLQTLWEFSESILPTQRVGDFNQALMELGSQICTAQNPKCEACPVVACCRAFAQKLQHQIPAKDRKTNYENIREAVVLIPRGNRFLVRQCGPDERWAGLWDFPRYAIPNDDSNQQESSRELQGPQPFIANQLASSVLNTLGLEVKLQSSQWHWKHAVTKYRIFLETFWATEVRGRLSRHAKAHNARWATLAEIDQLPMSITGRKIAHKINSTCLD